MLTHQFSYRSRRGIALVIVLSMIVLITALVVSFTMSMRTERQVSHTMSENERVKLVANAALAHAVGILDANIPQPVPPGAPTPAPVNWAVNPGMLNVIQGTSTVTRVPLSTNPGPDYVSSTQDANVNQLQPTSNQYPVTGAADPMYVAWAPVLQNPAAAASSTNPITARYAFWIDDENAKINVNTAYGKSSGATWTNPITEAADPAIGADDVVPPGHPGSVNLDVFGSVVSPKLLLGSLKTRGAAKTPEIIKTAVTNGDPEAFYKANKFYLTATSRDPEFNVFGKSKLYMYAALPGQLDTKQGGGIFQRFRDVDAPMYFHGSENRSYNPTSSDGANPAQDYTAMYYTAANLSSILNRTDWPGMPARSFVNKWGGTATSPTNHPARREADQVAWNMVALGSFADYGAYTTATPGLSAAFGNHLSPGKTGSSGSINYPNAAVPVGSLSGRAIIPAMPRPMVDEVCLNILPEAVTVSGATKYRLKFTASYGVWLPPGYPTADLSQPAGDLFVGLTHLEYIAKQQDGTTQASQSDSKYLNNGYEGVKKMQALDNFDTMNPETRLTVLSIRNVPNPDLTPQFYARNGAGFSNSTVGVVSFPASSIVNVTMRMRLYVHSISVVYTAQNQAMPTQLIPIWDTHDPGATAAPTSWNANAPSLAADSQIYRAFYPPLPNDPNDPNEHDYIEFNFDLDLAQVGGIQCTRSLRVADPRTSGLSRTWKASWKDSSGNDLPNAKGTSQFDSLGATHNGETEAAITAGWNLDKFAYVDMGPSALSHPSIGIFSVVPTSMQRGLIGSNLKLQPNTTAGELPDWLLLDIFAPTVSPSATSTGWADIVRMNATAGKININSAIYPNTGSFAVPTRLVPLQALLKYTPAEGAVQNIVNHTLAAGGSNYAGGGKFYNYPGEICEIQGVADAAGSSDWEKERTIRNLASVITTKSNTFRIWGVAQSLRKLSANHQYGQYETGDPITGEKRFEAIVERAVWRGADNVAGNGHINANGIYDQPTQGATQPGVAPSGAAYNWEQLDGPSSDAPTYPIALSTDANNATQDPASDPYNKNAPSSFTASTSLETANNPVRATMKYRVIYFKYLD